MFNRIKYFLTIDVYLNVKWFFQRLIRGYSDDEVWNVNTAVLRYALPRIKHLRKITKSYPALLCDEAKPTEDKLQEWYDILDKMILAIELEIKDEYWFGHNADKEMVEVKEGMDLFHKYFDGLWD